jgi:hypothetical protein
LTQTCHVRRHSPHLPWAVRDFPLRLALGRNSSAP